MSVNADNVFLILAAGRMLDGLRMTDAYYDTNPPLCYMLYLPAALLVKAGLPIWRAPFFYGCAVAAVSWFLTERLLRAVPSLDAPRRWGIVTAFAIGTAFCALYALGQKDQLIALAIFPFLLAQYALTSRASAPWTVRTAIILGIPFILAKPHFGLLAVCMLVHRAVSRRSFMALFGFDFWALAVGTLTYAAMLFFLFPDFISEVLRASLMFYVSVPNYRLILPMAMGLGLMGLCVLIVSWAADAHEPLRRFSILLSFLNLAVIIPVLVQLKGFSVHMIPALGLLAPAAFLAVSLHMKVFAQKKIPAAAVTALMLLAAYTCIPLNFQYPTHKDYMKTPWARYVSEHAAGSSFLAQTDSTNIFYPVSAYTGVPFATRFSAFWFLPGLYEVEGDPVRTAMKERFADDIADDLDRHKPAFVALYADPPPQLDFVALLGGNARFKTAWSHYRFKERFTTNFEDYFRGTALAKGSPDAGWPVYNIYVRQD